jgi:hypothetical protein
MNAITVVVLAVALALSPAAAAQRSELGGKVRSGRTVTVAAIPLVGGWLEALMVLLGLGALLLMARPTRRPIAQPVS